MGLLFFPSNSTQSGRCWTVRPHLAKMQLDTVILIISSKMETKTIRTTTKHKINFINTYLNS